jgi:hypothetical protein
MWIRRHLIDTLSEYWIFTTFPLQQYLHEHASMLRYTYIACLVVQLFLVVVRIIWNIQMYVSVQNAFFGVKSICELSNHWALKCK